MIAKESQNLSKSPEEAEIIRLDELKKSRTLGATTKQGSESKSSEKKGTVAKAHSRGLKKEPKSLAKEAAKSPIKTATSFGLAFTEARPGEDFIYFLIIILSLLADAFGILLYGSNLTAIFFSALFWILYALKGHFRKRWKKKIAVTGGSQMIEIFGLGINILPAFTFSGLMNYWFVLAERRMAKVDSGKNKQQKDNVSSTAAADDREYKIAA